MGGPAPQSHVWTRALALASVCIAAFSGCLGNGTADDEGSVSRAPPSATDRPGSSGASGPSPAGDPGAATGAGNASTPGTAAAASVVWPPIDQARIRPGVRFGIEAPLGIDTGKSGCTANFVFVGAGPGAEAGALYVGSAAHCSDADVGESVPIADGVAQVSLAYCSFVAERGSCRTELLGNPTNDFSLWRVADADRSLVHPSVRGWPGPNGLADCSAAPVGTQVVAYGNSSFKPDDESLKRLTGEVTTQRGDGSVIVRFLPPGVPADSGSPVLSADGKAFGIVRTLGFDGTNGLTCLDFALASAAANGAPPVALATWAGNGTG